MPAGTTPVFVATPKTWSGEGGTANTARDGTGTLITVVTGASTGSVVELVRAQFDVTTTAGVVRLFLSLDGGTTKRLVKELLIPAVTPSTTVEAASVEWIPTVPLILPDGSAVLYASTHNAENVCVFAHGGDY